MQHNIPSQRKTETLQKTSDNLGNLCINKTNVDNILEAIFGDGQGKSSKIL